MTYSVVIVASVKQCQTEINNRRKTLSSEVSQLDMIDTSPTRPTLKEKRQN